MTDDGLGCGRFTVTASSICCGAAEEAGVRRSRGYGRVGLEVLLVSSPVTMSPASMSATELSAARAELGLTAEEFATELELTPERYAAYEAGSARLPKYQAKLVAFQ